MRKLVLLTVALMLACHGSRERTVLGPDEVLLFTASAASIPASGFSSIQLTAKIDPLSAPTNRMITFRTTDGTLVGVGTSAENGKKLDVLADATGIATAQLQSSTSPGHVIVTAAVGTTVVRTISVDFTPPSAADIVRISVSNTAPPADGATILQVYADVAPALTGDQRNVTFTTIYGTFIGGTNHSVVVRADNRNRATADLQTPPDAVTTRLTAAVSGVLAETNLMFVPALPDLLRVDPATVEMKASTEIIVTATLSRNLGSVTAGRIITFTATDAQGQTIGGFRNIGLSTSEQKATAVYSPGSTTYRGLVTLRATTLSASGTILSAETTVRITD
ncbi:MAG TPA: hypothetical protein VJ901_03275 [Thermoanaerobaculia bacterium]|nr:hypothetical protein [Thermoanaerobaculia bacterium]